MTSNRQSKPSTTPNRTGRRGVVFAVATLAAFAAATPVQAQTPKQPDVQQQAAAQKADISRTQALSRRVEQLEEQIVDLQVVIGTLESLAKTGATPGRAAFSNGSAASAGAGRNASMETQVNALSAQVARLSAEVQALRTGRAAQPIAATQTPAPRVSSPQPPRSTNFGATTVRRVEGGDAIGTLIESQQPAAPQSVAVAPAAPQTAAPQNNAPNPKSIYEAAYAQVLQQDYKGAQAGFRAFLRDYPEHALVPNALYWLGETYYVQQNYTDAAEAFDIVTAAYGASNKAPDSQLKRGMALANLGKRSEACSVLRALAKRYPNAPPHVKSKADSERQRVGCS